MKHIPYIPPYDRIPHGFCPADESDYICPICGKDIAWWKDETAYHKGYLCHSDCIERSKNMEEEMETKTTSTDLIQVVQLPVIREQLRTLKESWEKRAADAEAMLCTEDTIQAVKKFRADINKEFEQVEALRKAVKEAVMKPYNEFEAVYKECVTTPKKAAEIALTKKVNEVESEQKKRCEDSLREYFSELCAAHHLDWLSYEHAGIKVDMASAKAKTPNKLREQLVQFVVRVAESVERISQMENADEIMVEFQRTIDASDAIFTVQERHRRIEQQRADNDSREADRIAQEAMQRKVEELYQKYLEPPTIGVKMHDTEEDDIIPRCTFTAVNATRSQLRKLKEFLENEGIQYE